MGKTLLEIVQDVHNARNIHATLKAELDAKRAQFDAENAGLIECVKDAALNVADTEEACRIGAINWYILTGKQTKQPMPGLGIRALRKVVYDAKDAARWCGEHNMFLSVDWKLFERFAKDNSESLAGIVSIEEELQATIATDLARALEGVS